MTDQEEATSALELQLAPREIVRIDGVTYDIAPLGGLGIAASARLTRHYQRISELQEIGENATEDDEREYSDRLLEIARVAIPDAPPEILAKLTLAQRKAVMMDFIERGSSSPEGLAILKSLQQIARRSLISSRTLRASTAQGNGS